MPVITESFIDLSLVKDMKIPMKKIECRNISYATIPTRLVGSISQTVQVVYDGVPSGQRDSFSHRNSFGRTVLSVLLNSLFFK